jgi:hypothetical protein
MVEEPQTATILINIEGVTFPLRLTRTVPACGSVVVGIHTLPGMPTSANYGVQVGWPTVGSATLIIRSLDNFWERETIPPIAVFR